MKVADHTLLTPFISADRQTGRQARQVPTSCRITPNYRISISTSGLSGQQPSTQWGFFSPPPHLCCAPTTRFRVTLIGSGEFKIPDCDWDCHHPGQHCKATTHPSYHRAAQHSRELDSGYCLANSTVYFTGRCARITQLWIIAVRVQNSESQPCYCRCHQYQESNVW